jgi:hypothetical protein
MNTLDILTSAYGKEIAQCVYSAYQEIEKHHTLGGWKTAEMDAGHFVEAVWRIIQKELGETPTPIGVKIPTLDAKALIRCESLKGDESFRMLIPRALFSIYSIRNKRGVGHLSHFKANRMDSAFLLHTAKWILAEIIRIKSNLSITETENIVGTITERQVDGLWKIDGIKIPLRPQWTKKEQILVCLFDESPLPRKKLHKFAEYKNSSDFNNDLRDLAKKKLIFCDDKEHVHILPDGTTSAEKLILALPPK